MTDDEWADDRRLAISILGWLAGWLVGFNLASLEDLDWVIQKQEGASRGQGAGSREQGAGSWQERVCGIVADGRWQMAKTAGEK